MTTGDNSFLDTNVLLRAMLPAMPQHQEAAELVAAQRARGSALWISRQVIREYLAVVTRPQTFVTPLTIDETLNQLATLNQLFAIADDTAEVTASLLKLLRRYPTGGKQVHDANIVATMIAYGISTLLTQNIADMQRFAEEITIIPLQNPKSR